MTDELPPGWATTTLGAVVQPPRSKASPSSHPELPFIGMDSIAPGSMELAGTARFGDMKSNGGLFHEGDVLYGRMRPYLNKVYRAKFTGACSAEFIVFPESEAIDPDFLAYLLHNKRFVNFASSLSSGDRPRVDFGDVSAYHFDLPPKPEQKRIVSKIDELFSRIDEGERALERVSRLVERYRQSVLKAAVTGELTRDWREQHKHTLESGEALLARILTARREAWEQAELAKMQAKGITPKDDKWKRKYKAPTSPDANDLPELPEGWVWVSIEMLTSPHGYALKAGPFGSALKKSDYSPGGYKIYGQEQVIAGDWSIGDYYIGKNKFRELESCAVEAHDVLISLVGTIGKVLVLPEECEPGIINPRLIKVSLNRMFYLPQFFKIYFESAFLKSLYKLEAHGATMDVLNLGIIKRLPFPLCSLEEQAQVIARSAYEFDRADRLNEWVGIERKRSSSFRQSVLKAAFSGHLVGQDPGDEPASVILKSIANERTTSRAAPKRGRKKNITA